VEGEEAEAMSDRMSDHIIVCGYGRVRRRAAAELAPREDVV
jgi:voltage-gated potassium channel Kch